MTDKQIIERLKTDLDFERTKRKTLQAELQAKEQECEELKSVRDSWISKCEQETKIKELYQDGLDQLKAENEELKEQLELNTANAVVIDMAQRLHNYKQSIEKIKELLQKEIDDCFDCGDCESCGYNCCLRQAMQICNEVLSE